MTTLHISPAQIYSGGNSRQPNDLADHKPKVYPVARPDVQARQQDPPGVKPSAVMEPQDLPSPSTTRY